MQFNWDATRDVNTFRVGYLKKAFVDRRQTAQTNANDAAAGRAPASWRVPFRSRSAGALVASAVGGDPSGSRDAATSLTFVGRVFGEAEMLALGSAYQDETGWHLKHPRL